MCPRYKSGMLSRKFSQYTIRFLHLSLDISQRNHSFLWQELLSCFIYPYYICITASVHHVLRNSALKTHWYAQKLFRHIMIGYSGPDLETNTVCKRGNVVEGVLLVVILTAVLKQITHRSGFIFLSRPIQAIKT